MHGENHRPFPRAVYDEMGDYGGGGNFCVSSALIGKFAVLQWTQRDLSTALDMIRECCKSKWADEDSPVSQALWWSAVVIYAKPFGRNDARRVDLLQKGWAYEHLKTQISAEALDLHEYLMHLRDKMMAHDDGLGENKDLVLSLPPSPPSHRLFIGIGTPNRRVVALGTEIATQLEPHFAEIHRIFTDLCNRERDAVCKQLLDTGFADITLLAPYVEENPAVDIQSVLDRFRRVSDKQS